MAVDGGPEMVAGWLAHIWIFRASTRAASVNRRVSKVEYHDEKVQHMPAYQAG